MSFLKRWLPVALWAAVILTTSNDSFSSSHTAGWLAALFGHALPELVNHTLRKLAHVIGYGILGVLAWRADRRALVFLGVTAFVAIVDEIHQSTTALRGGSPWDVLLDLGGAALAVYLIVPAVRARLSSRAASARSGPTRP